jgi:hypothetical protein
MDVTIKRLSGSAAITMISPASFALIPYQNKVTGRVEWVWNPRNGDAPFLIPDPSVSDDRVAAFDEGVAAGRIDPKKEPRPDMMAQGLGPRVETAFAPNFVPAIGTRIISTWADLPKRYADAVRALWQEEAEKLSPAEEKARLKQPPFGYMPSTLLCIIVDEIMHREYSGLAATNAYQPAPPPRLARPTPGLIIP